MTRRATNIAAFFDAVGERLAKRYSRQWHSVFIRLHGRLIELRFATRLEALYATLGLGQRMSPPPRIDRPDALFVYWQDDVESYVGTVAERRLQARTPDGLITFVAGEGLVACDWTSQTYLCCRDRRAEPQWMLGGHALSLLFGLWAQSQGLVMVHGAAVGSGGQGALIAGPSGAGKSTLAASCLLGGLEVLSDDYVLLEGGATTRAWPIYSTIALNEDVCPMLGCAMDILEVSETGKRTLDAADRLFPGPLEIRAVVYLGGRGAEEPAIVPARSRTPYVRSLCSTLIQLGIARQSRDLLGTISHELLSLPNFEFLQSDDPHANTECLRHFLEREM